ncbi:MAG: hypothetical protein Q9178_008082 [Gyalolechia marmorata]
MPRPTKHFGSLDDLNGRIGMYEVEVRAWIFTKSPVSSWYNESGKRASEEDSKPEDFGLNRGRDINDAAQELEAQIRTSFQKIVFEEVVRYTLNQTSVQIKGFLDGAQILKDEIQSDCKRSAKLSKYFQAVYRASRGSHPITQWIVNPAPQQEDGNAVLKRFILYRCHPCIIDGFSRNTYESYQHIILHGIEWDKVCRKDPDPNWVAPSYINYPLLFRLRNPRSAANWLCQKDHEVLQRSSCEQFVKTQSWERSKAAARWFSLRDCVEAFFRSSNTRLWLQLYEFFQVKSGVAIKVLYDNRNFFSLSASLYGALNAGNAKPGEDPLVAMTWGDDGFVGLTYGGDFIGHPYIERERRLIEEHDGFRAYRALLKRGNPFLPYYYPHIVNGDVDPVHSEDVVLYNPLKDLIWYDWWLRRETQPGAGRTMIKITWVNLARSIFLGRCLGGRK